MVRKSRKQQTGFKRLESKLLEIGGDRVVELPEPHMDIILERGRLFESAAWKRVKGERNECHQNAALHYLAYYNEECGASLEFARGYYLIDGYWRQHSWLWDGKRVLETTCKGERYFGVLLTPDEATDWV